MSQEVTLPDPMALEAEWTEGLLDEVNHRWRGLTKKVRDRLQEEIRVTGEIPMHLQIDQVWRSQTHNKLTPKERSELQTLLVGRFMDDPNSGPYRIVKQTFDIDGGWELSIEYKRPEAAKQAAA